MANWESVQLDPYDEEMTNLAFGPMLELPHYLLLPGRFVLAATERVTLGNQLVAQVAGKSSLARDCLVVENAGYIDPGFDGPITMELFNQGPFTLVLTAGMPIAQLAVTRLDSPANPVYSGKYLGASGPQVSMYWKNKRPGAGA